MANADSYNERKCYMCGKVFIIHDPDEWVFKRMLNGTHRCFCSWSCIKKYDLERGMTRTERREKVIQALKDGLTVSEICKLTGMDRTNVVYWEKKIRGGDAGVG